jgi:hypothetical protein
VTTLVILIAGAGVAAYAALNKKSAIPPKARTLALAPTATPALPATATPSLPGKAGHAAKPPSLPATPSTPGAKEEAEPPPPPEPAGSEGSNKSSEHGASEGTKSAAKSPSKSRSTTPASEAVTPIVLDTNAAATYNPFNYPATDFGDPRLAIDGDATTSWTATVNPAVAPKMAAGLLVNLKQPTSVAKLSLVTSTPGLTIQVYATEAKTPPANITPPSTKPSSSLSPSALPPTETLGNAGAPPSTAPTNTPTANNAPTANNEPAPGQGTGTEAGKEAKWTKLTGSHEVKTRKATIKLKHANKRYRFILIWIPKAPAGLVGTVQAPATVDLNEVVLDAPKP